MNTKSKTQNPDTHFRIMNLINKYPNITQRELAQRTGVSLGSMHYCVKALVKKGWVKAGNFRRNPNKSAYLYLLTSEGVSQKSKMALDFLQRKKKEYDALKSEIKKLTEEING
jgi:MarR family transcriptional regulator, temperature-dependent positive regulator of motility